MRSTAIALLIASAGAAALAQAPQTQKPPQAGAGTGAISGVVLDGSTNQPIAGAIVTLSTSARGFQGIVLRLATDSAGRFVFSRLPSASAYYLHVLQFGYFDGGYGRDVPATTEGRPIALDDGEWFNGAKIQLSRPASIAGRVIDEAGEPVVGAFVRVLPQVLVAGLTQTAAGPVTRTDDRGVYRVGGLAPGKFIVSFPSVQIAVPADASPLALANLPPERYAAGLTPAIPNTVAVDASASLVVGNYPVSPSRDGRAQAYPPMFYPSARTISEAGIVEVRYGEERGGIDFQLRPEATARVSGRVVGPVEAYTGLTLRLVPKGSEGLGLGSEVASALVGADGAFTMLHVPVGDYTLLSGQSTMQYHYAPGGSNLQTELPSPPAYSGLSGAGNIGGATTGVGYTFNSQAGDRVHWGRMPLSVNAPEVKDIVLDLTPGIAVRGRVVWESGSPQPMTVASGAAGGPPPPPTNYPLYADPADGNAELGLPAGTYNIKTHEFEVTGLRPGLYRLRIGGAPNAKSITWNGRDLTYEPFDASQGHDFDGVVVTVTDKTATIEGSVRDESGNRVRTAAVLAFPTDLYAMESLRLLADAPEGRPDQQRRHLQSQFAKR